MENRFGVKDFVLFTLIGVLIVMVALAMVEFDRQFEKIQTLTSVQQQQAGDLGQIQSTLKTWSTSGPIVATTAGSPIGGSAGAGPAADPNDPFSQMRIAEKMPGYAPGDTLVTPAPNSSKLTPLLDTDAFAGAVQDFTLQSLLDRDPVTLKWRGLLAQPGWTVTDNSEAYLAYRKDHPAPPEPGPGKPVVEEPNCPIPIQLTFDIRPEAAFADGQPVTADDVVWTFDWIMNPDVEASRQRSALHLIKRAVKTGERQVRFDFAEPYFDYLGLAGGMAVLPKHWYVEHVPTPAQYNKIPCALIGSGPFQLKEPMGWHPGEEVVLFRNEKYWGPKPALSSIRYRIMVQDQVKLTALKNQEIDLLAPSPVQFESLLKDQSVVTHTQHYVYDTPRAGYQFVAWNQFRNNKPTQFADKRVRRAMTMLIDRQRICDEILLKYASVVSGPFSRLGKQLDPTIQPLPFDVAKAQELLEDAGYKDDGTGTLKNAGGEPLKFRLTYGVGSPVVDREVLFIKDTMAQAGVTLEPDPLDWSVFSDRLKNHDFDAIMLRWQTGIEDDIYQMFDSKQIDNQGENWNGYRNPALDALIEQARQTVDEDKRDALWRKCHAILHEDQPYSFLLTSKSLAFLDNRFNNVHLIPLGLNDRSEWFVPSGLQKYRQ